MSNQTPIDAFTQTQRNRQSRRCGFNNSRADVKAWFSSLSDDDARELLRLSRQAGGGPETIRKRAARRTPT